MICWDADAIHDSAGNPEWSPSRCFSGQCAHSALTTLLHAYSFLGLNAKIEGKTLYKAI